MLGALTFGGMLVGALFWAVVSDKYGRRMVVIATVFTVAVSGTWNSHSKLSTTNKLYKLISVTLETI